MAKVTVDNLGSDASIRYALDQETLQATPQTKAPTSLPQIDVSSPAFPLEIEELLQMGRSQNVWASFFTPPTAPKQTGILFTFCLAPSLGSEEKREALSGKIMGSSQTPLSSTSWQAEQDREARTKQQKTLTTLLNTIGNLDKLLTAINSGRNQFQKG